MNVLTRSPQDRTLTSNNRFQESGAQNSILRTHSKQMACRDNERDKDKQLGYRQARRRELRDTDIWTQVSSFRFQRILHAPFGPGPMLQKTRDKIESRKSQLARPFIMYVDDFIHLPPTRQPLPKPGPCQGSQFILLVYYGLGTAVKGRRHRG